MKSMTNACGVVPAQVSESLQVLYRYPEICLGSIEQLALGLRLAVEYASFSFEGTAPGLEYHVGHIEPHRCSYAITMPGDVSIGKLEVTRHRPFQESELRLLECCVADFCMSLETMFPRNAEQAYPTVAYSIL